MAKHIFQYRTYIGQTIRVVLTTIMILCIDNIAQAQQQKTIVRVSEIEVHSEHLNEYSGQIIETCRYGSLGSRGGHVDFQKADESC
uniref:Uncharacterized protein n=1 Tax=Sphingobacterium sp. (strain 21) TaxID=743722 RepID=F4C4H1_SPHS2